MAGHGVGHTVGNEGVLRRLVIVAVLTAVLIVLPEFRVISDSSAIDPTSMVALGFIVLAAYAIGELVEVIGLPHITGYLLAGLLYGPSLAHVLPPSLQIGALEHGILTDNADPSKGPLGVIQQLGLLDSLAVALIALTAGGELKLDDLRKGARAIAGMLVGQSVTIIAGVTAFMVLIGGAVPSIGIASLGQFGTSGAVAFGLLVSAISLATSPASTIAVINGAQAQGPVSKLVLSAVVLKDVVVVVLFAIFGALAGSLLGVSTSDQSLLMYLWEHVGQSVIAGFAVGGLLYAYLRFIGVEVLLFLVGLIYAMTWVAQTMHWDPVLLFIAAGFAAGSSQQGDELIHHVERLSLPVYVVFFTLTGARMHLDSLVAMAPYALALVVIRLVMLLVGVRLGAQVAGAPSTVVKYGWLGFASQAGVAITLATLVGKTFGGPEFNGAGQDLQTLVIAAIAVNEFIGPVLLKLALQLAGELPGASHGAESDEHSHHDAVQDDPTAESGLPVWQPPPGRPVEWGEPLATEADHLNRVVHALQDDLVGLVRDMRQGPVEDWRDESQAYLRTLRREFLRHHRRALVRTQKHTAPDDGLELCLGEGASAELAERWRAVVLDRSAMVGKPDEGPMNLVRAVDKLVLGLPGVLHVPVELESYQSPPDESPLRAISRSWLRIRRGFYGLTGGGELQRDIDVRRLAEFHLSGTVAGRLEPYAALLVLAEDHLASRTRAIFDNLLDSYEELGRKWTAPGANAEDRVEWLQALRRELEEDFQIASEEIERVAEEASLRAARGLAGAYADFALDCYRAGTLDLPDRAYQYSRVFSRRTAEERLLTEGLGGARRNAAAGYAALALELELMGLEGRIQSAVAMHGDQLGRMVHGRGPKQLDRVDGSLRQVLTALDGHLSKAETGDQLAAWIRGDAEPLERVVSEAHKAAVQLRAHLTAESTMTPLLDELLTAAQALTDRYRVPASRRLRGDHALPPLVETVDIPFSELVITYVESGVTREVMELSRGLATDVDKLVAVLDELERVVAFNVELAGAELDVFDNEAIPDATRALVREIVAGALTRTRTRLQELREEASLWEDRARDGLFKAVVHELDELRAKIADGRVGELRRYLSREAANRRLQRGSGVLWQRVDDLRRQAVGTVRESIGEERLHELRAVLGLPTVVPPDPVHRRFFAPEPQVELPVVYRRLFSDQALEAGDLLTGRQSELDRAHHVLDSPGRHRAVALIGLDGVGKGAVINALVRSMDQRRVKRIHLTEPVSVHAVDRWFDEGLGGMTVVLTGLQWTFTMQPHGFDPLRRLIDRMITDPSDARWVLGAEIHVWHSAAEVVPLEDAFPDIIELDPLDAPALEAALLARHTMSGYRLQFTPHHDLRFWWRSLTVRGDAQAAREQELWFTALAEATGGVVQDALRLWMASITEVDEQDGIVHIGPVPLPPERALQGLPDDLLLTLRQVARQGWMTPDLHATLFRTDVQTARAHLNRIAHLGLLEDRGKETYAFHPAFTGPLHRLLQERGWLR